MSEQQKNKAKRSKHNITIVRSLVTMDDLRDLARLLSSEHHLDRATVELEVMTWYFLRDEIRT